MERKDTPDKIPALVGQALEWIRKMGLPCRYLKDDDWWEILYKNVYVLIPNYVADDEIGFITCALAKGQPDDEVCRMVYDFAMKTSEGELSDCEVDYIENGLCQVSQWWLLKGRQKLYKYRLKEKLDELLKRQWTLMIHLYMAYEALFNPPAEVLKEIFGEDSNDKA